MVSVSVAATAIAAIRREIGAVIVPLVSAVAVMHDDMHQRQAARRRYGKAPKTCAVCSVRRKKPPMIRKPQRTIPNGVCHQGF
jgi:hypothetical protein